jgi:hypothetical protein
VTSEKRPRLLEASPTGFAQQERASPADQVNGTYHPTDTPDVHHGSAGRAFDGTLVVPKLRVIHGHFLAAGKTFYDHLRFSLFDRL